jgi:nitrogen fixation/metabolism regulation signal transduction histidine kinase
MRALVIAMAILAAICLLLLAAASANSPLLSGYFQQLLWANAGIAIGLLVLLLFQLFRLVRQRRQRVFGSLLASRLLLLFSLFALLPGVLVYTVSVQFLTRSIESWFDVRVDRALEGGLNLGRAALDALLQDLSLRAGAMALALSEVPTAQQPLLVARVREQIGAEDVLLLSTSGKPLAGASRQPGRKPPVPSDANVRLALQNANGFAIVEPFGDKGLMMRTIVQVRPAPELQPPGQLRLLQLTQPVPPTLAEAGDAVQSVFHAYKELSLSRQGLKQTYILTLTLSLLLALFAALAIAFLLSRRIARPLAILAEGTEAVTRGDFSRRADVTSGDEFGILTRSFNSMTGQLDEARQAAEVSRQQLEMANGYLESVLANLSAGVLVFDANFALTVANRGATGILGQSLEGQVGKPLAQWSVAAEFARLLSDELNAHHETVWQRQIEIEAGATILLLRGSPLPAASGFVVVFDDITQLIAAQRATAWGEVARRLAHEIKNPLTPIQLSAERLQAKLGPRLAPDDAQALKRATDTIVVQVQALTSMVNDFRDYARTPLPVLASVDLNQLVNEVLDLYEQSSPRIQSQLAAQLPLVRADVNQIRQVIHNLLTNAQDALAQEVLALDALAQDSTQEKNRSTPLICISTERSRNHVWLRVTDNGSGFPESIIKRAFEPYVTTKPKGTGLGLAIVKKILDEHQGQIVIENLMQSEGAVGARVSISLPLAA